MASAPDTNTQRLITLTPEQITWLDSQSNRFNFSHYIQDRIDATMNPDYTQYPLEHLVRTHFVYNPEPIDHDQRGMAMYHTLNVQTVITDMIGYAEAAGLPMAYNFTSQISTILRTMRIRRSSRSKGAKYLKIQYHPSILGTIAGKPFIPSDYWMGFIEFLIAQDETWWTEADCKPYWGEKMSHIQFKHLFAVTRDAKLIESIGNKWRVA